MVLVMHDEAAMYRFMYSKPTYITRTCTEPERPTLPAIYTIPDTNLNNAGPTREIPPRTNPRYDIRPEMAVGPNGVLDSVVYDMDDTGVYHPNPKKARALEKEMGVDEDKEAVKKRKQRMMYQQRAQKMKEKSALSNGGDQNVDNTAVEDRDSDNETLELERSLPIVIKLSSESGKAGLKAIGTEGNQWPAFKYSPPAEIALENIITADGRKRKAPPIRFESESDDEVDYESDDDHDEDWKAPGKRVRRTRLTKSSTCKDSLDVRSLCSGLAEDDGAEHTLSNGIQSHMSNGSYLEGHSCKDKIYDDPVPSKDSQKLYCTCQQPEKGFMILCEGPCNNWYHGRCVGVTARKAGKMAKYTCKDCTAAETQEDGVVGESNFTTHHAHDLQSNVGRTHVGFQTSGTQQDPFVGRLSNTTTWQAEPLAASYSDSAQVGFQGAGIQEDTGVGDSNITIHHAHHLQSSFGPTHVAFQTFGTQQGPVVGQWSNTTTCQADPFVASYSDPAQVGFQSANIQQDAVIGQWNNTTTYQANPFVASYPGPAQVGFQPAEILHDAVIGQRRLVTDYYEHPVESSAGNQGAVDLGGAKIITTRLAQPVQFNFEPDPAHGLACHWCDGPVYAVLGLPKMTYRVRESSNYLGYQEVDGGHRSKGHPASRMCIACTSKRVDILCCPGHTFELLPANEYQANRDAARRLRRQQLVGNEKESQWCSVCPNPARYRCNKSDGDNRDGCGLKLCSDCASWCVVHHNSDLEAYIVFLITKMVKANGEEWVGVRPDAVFLLDRGEMAMRLTGGFQ